VHFHGRTVLSVNDRGVWERHIVEVTLDGGEIVFFKIQLTDWDMTGFETKGVQLFQEHGLPTPRILAVDVSHEILPHPYLIQERRGGTRLGALLDKADQAEAERIYESLGRFYRQMHAVHNDWSGLLIPISGSPAPNEYMYQAEIVGWRQRQARSRRRTDCTGHLRPRG
jgi:aminoglycoside phosphotransferase (APT) family kinase protein